MEKLRLKVEALGRLARLVVGGSLFPGSLRHFCRAQDAELRGGEHILPVVLWEGQQRKQPALIHFLARKVRTNQSIFLLFILKFIYFKLKDNRFTILYWFLPYISTNQP